MIQSGWDRVPYRQRKETDPRRQVTVGLGAANHDGEREGGREEDGGRDRQRREEIGGGNHWKRKRRRVETRRSRGRETGNGETDN
jgi:hypothetical protein